MAPETDLAQSSPPKGALPRKRGRQVILGIIAGCMLLSATSTAWLWTLSSRATNLAREITTTTVEIEDAIGYSGLIHHFKNAVLRPDEPEYISLARRDHARALTALTRLDDLAMGVGEDIDTAPLLATLKQYHDFLAVIEEGHASNLPIQQVDALVRVDDTAAAATIVALNDALVSAVDKQHRQLTMLLGVSVMALALISTLLMVTIARLRLVWQNDRLLAQTLLYEQEQAHGLELEEALTRLQQTHRELAEFTYSLSHDLKSPTNTAQMIVAMLNEDLGANIDPDSQMNLADLDRVLARMTQMIQDVLDYTGSLNHEVTMLPVSLDVVLADVAVDLRPELESTGATLSCDPLPIVLGDKGQLHRVLLNLVENALKYRAADRPLRVRVTPVTGPDGAPGFAVSDNGIGIAEEHHGKIFNLFARLHNQSTIEGTGLGLPICKRIAQAHGGGIAVASGGPDQGATFTVMLGQRAPNSETGQTMLKSA